MAKFLEFLLEDQDYQILVTKGINNNWPMVRWY